MEPWNAWLEYLIWLLQQYHFHWKTVANNFNTRSFTITHRVFVSVKILYQSERKHGFLNFPDYDPILSYSDSFNVLMIMPRQGIQITQQKLWIILIRSRPASSDNIESWQ